MIETIKIKKVIFGIVSLGLFTVVNLFWKWQKSGKVVKWIAVPTIILAFIGGGVFTYLTVIKEEPTRAASACGDTQFQNNSGGASVSSFYAQFWRGQSFTPTTTHTITCVELEMIKVGSPPGDLTVIIKATSAGVPSGAIMATGTLAASTWATTPGSVEAITLDNTAELTASTMYALYFYLGGGDGSNKLQYLYGSSFAGGTTVSSDNSGSTWAAGATDLNFAEHGTAVSAAVETPMQVIEIIGN